MRTGLKSNALRMAAVLAGCAGLLCSGGPDLAGGSGTDAPNSVVVISENGGLRGCAPENCRVGIYAEDYVPYNDSGFSMTAVVGTDRKFEARGLDSGSYNVVATDASGDRGVFFGKVVVAGGLGRDSVSDSLRAVATLTGTLLDPRGNPAKDLPVFLEGSPFWGNADANGLFALDGVPRGEYRILSAVVPWNRINDVYVVADTLVVIEEGETRDVGIIPIARTAVP